MTVQFRNSKIFLANKPSSEVNFDESVHIYKWMGQTYDLKETLPAKNPVKVIHFVINNFHYILVAEGGIGTVCVVYIYLR